MEVSMTEQKEPCVVVAFKGKFVSPDDRQVKHELDRDMARAMVEAGYMPLDRYIELYG